MHDAKITRLGDSPAHAGVLHIDGALSEVKVETNEHDEFVVTLDCADGKRMVIHDDR